MARVIAPAKPETLEWARKNAGFESLSSAIEKISWLRSKHRDGKDAEDILRQIESGEREVSLAQARDMAKAYHVSVPFFYLPLEEAEKHGFVPIKDFRHKDHRNLSSNAIRFLRDAQAKQEWARESLQADQVGSRDWISAFSENWHERERECVGFLLERLEGTEPTLESWVDNIEERLGVFVMQSRVTSYHYALEEEFSGCALLDDIAPVVVLNYKNIETRRLFTLLHEMAHLLIGQSGVSQIEFRVDRDTNAIEQFCNRVASEVLMPTKRFTKFWHATGGDASKTPQQFGASPSAAIMRALQLGFVSCDEADRLLQERRSVWLEQQVKGVEFQGGGGRFPAHEAADRNGKRLTRYILDSYNSGRISALEVSHLLDMKLNYLPKIAEITKTDLQRWGSSQ